MTVIAIHPVIRAQLPIVVHSSLLLFVSLPISSTPQKKHIGLQTVKGFFALKHSNIDLEWYS